jgi:PII-like signaling protein
VDDQALMARVYISEADHGRRQTLMRDVLNLLHDRHRVQGVVVFRGIAGFGADGEVHASDMLRLNVDLPLVIEFFDRPDVVRSAVALLDDLIPDGHIVTWPVTRHRKPAPQRT